MVNDELSSHDEAKDDISRVSVHLPNLTVNLDINNGPTPRIPRRGLVKRIVKAGLLTYTAANTIGYKIREEVLDTFFADALHEDIAIQQQWLSTNYGFEIDFSDLFEEERREKKLDGEPAGLTEKSAALKWIRQEISKYPPEFVRNWCKLKEFRVLKGIQFASTKENNIKGIVGGITYPGQSLIYLSLVNGNLDTFLSILDSPMMRKLFHHELFHLADSIDGMQTEDAAWAALNTPGTQPYLREKFAETVDKLGTFESLPHEGYVRSYGRVDENEDQATIPEELMVSPDGFQDKIENKERDEVLIAKTKRIKEYYYEWSKGKMNEQYWKDLAEGKVNENYWKPASLSLNRVLAMKSRRNLGS